MIVGEDIFCRPRTIGILAPSEKRCGKEGEEGVKVSANTSREDVDVDDDDDEEEDIVTHFS